MMINKKVKITINTNHEDVFKYVANLKNDKFWRKEVNWVLQDGDFGLGSLAVECSFLSKRVPEYIQKLECVKYTFGHEIVYQTLMKNQDYLKSTRIVIPINENQTEFTYKLKFNPSIAYHGLGFRIPSFLISIVTKRAMLKYVKLLKGRIEFDGWK